MFNEFDEVKLIRSIPSKGLASGMQGRVVSVHVANPPTYEVVFWDEGGHEMARLTLSAHEITMAEQKAPILSDIHIYHTDSHILLQLGKNRPEVYTEVSAVIDLDPDGKLLGVELFLFTGEALPLGNILEQFSGFDNITVNDDGYMYVYVRNPNEKTVSPRGYTLTVSIGLDSQGSLSLLLLPWSDPNLEDWRNVLAGLTFHTGVPTWN
jgi:hypothetical protein